MNKMRLDKYEKAILNSYEQGGWKSIKNVKQEIKKHMGYARNTLKKDKRVNIRISTKDLENIQIIAIQEGLPYQTLISSIIHKYISSQYSYRNQMTTQSSGRK